MRKKMTFVLAGAVILLMALVCFILAKKSGLLQPGSKTAKDFGIETIKSSCDADNDGTDDYADIMLGARLDAQNHPRYDGAYQAGGYPPDDVGVCTDVVWRAFKNAGYDLRRMVDNDIALYPGDYPAAQPSDSNIDFRRVSNLNVFFKKYARSLSTDVFDIEQWQPGDIVVFKDDAHIGIVSDKRNDRGVTWLIHNSGQPRREEDRLETSSIAAHYRFDASMVDSSVIFLWQD